MPDVRAPTPEYAPPIGAGAVLAALVDPVLLLEARCPGDWRIAWANEAYQQATGWTLEELLGGPAPEVIRRRDGSPVACELTRGTIPTEPGEPARGWVIARIQDDRYRALLENITDAVTVLDADAIIRYASPSVRALGLDPQALVGTSAFDLFDPSHHGDHLGRLAGILASPGIHGPWRFEVTDAEGRPHPVEVVANNRLADPSIAGIVVTARSVAERVASQEALARSERRFRALVQHSSDIVILIDPGGVVRFASPAVERGLGRSIAGVPFDDTGLAELVPEWVPERLATHVDHPGSAVMVETPLTMPDGSEYWLEIGATNLLDDPDVEGILIFGRDVTERKRTESLLAAELDVLERMAESHTVVPVLRRIAEVAETFLPGTRCTVGVLDADGIIRHPAAPTLPPAMVALLDAAPADGTLGRHVRSHHDWYVFEDIVSDPAWGEMGPIARRHGLRACWGFPVHGSDGVLGTIAIFAPVPRGPHPSELPLLERLRHLAHLALERSRFESRLREQAVHDALTNLPNRTLLLHRVEQALELGQRRSTQTAVLFVDLDQFKIVNDSLGHAKGDELLRQVASRFATAVRRGDTVGRFGGDEFLVVAEDVAGEDGAVVAAERLVAALAQPFTIDGAQVVVNASIGVALAGPEAARVGPDALVRNADAAMYRAKDAGRNQIAIFEDTLHAELVRRYEVEQGLRTAVERDELVVLYQPIVQLAAGRLVGVEALVRWDRPGHGLVGADEIVPIAEETGLIVPIGAHVLRTACAQAVAWDREPATAGLAVSVNLSARQLGDPGLVATVASTLAATGLRADRLCLEVTESALARDPQGAAVVLTSLKRLGVRLAIDDFGTGYATLDYVRRFSMADDLKIDRSFVAGLGDLHSPDAAIVSAAIVLAEALGFTTVAEGVEAPEQLAVLRRLGCETAQGWYFGRPVPASEIG